MEFCRERNSETSERCTFCDNTVCPDHLEEGVCGNCQSIVAKTANFVKTEQLQWGVLSPRGSEWIKSCSLNSYISKFQGADISAYLLMEISLEDHEHIEKDIQTGRTDPGVFNIELKHVLSRNFSRDSLDRVLRAYCAKNSGIGYCQGLNYVATWLLLFLDENNAFWMLSYLVEKWLLPDFYIGNKRGNSLNGFYIESSVISRFLEHKIPSVKNFHKTNEFCDMFSLQLLIQLFIDKISLENTAYFWDKLMSEGSIALIRGTMSLLLSERESIEKGEHPIRILKQLVFKENSKNVQEFYEDCIRDITVKRVTKLRKQATAYRAKQWQTNSRMVMNRLEKHSEFNKEEIEMLQTEFTEYLQSRERKNRVSERTRGSLRISWMETSTLDIGIDKDEFLDMIRRISPNMGAHAGALFDQFDDDRSGFLDFRELMMCLSILTKGTFEDKLRLCFDSYDFDKSGYLHIEEARCLVDTLLKPLHKQLEKSCDSKLKENIQQIQSSIMGLVSSERNILSFNSLYSAVMSSPLLYSWFDAQLSYRPVRHLKLVLKRRTQERQLTCCSGCLLL